MLTAFQQQTMTAAEAAEQLGLSRSRFYTLATACLRAATLSPERLWTPGTSGGNHAATLAGSRHRPP